MIRLYHLYLCDRAKNTLCPAVIHDVPCGECRHTSIAEYSTDGKIQWLDGCSPHSYVCEICPVGQDVCPALKSIRNIPPCKKYDTYTDYLEATNG